MPKQTPRHIGIIPDGNRRWAVEKGMKKQDGYEYGLLPGLKLFRMAKQYGIEEITYYGFTWWKLLIVAGITSIIGQIGDLVASALKRSARVKDYGTIFPGHGGVMDRVDGLIFNFVAVLISMFILM